MCDSADTSYIQKLGYLQLNDDTSHGRVLGSRPEAQVPVGRSSASRSDARVSNRSVGAIESFIDPTSDTCRPTVPPADYKMYERENIIAASRFATPKPVEQISTHQQHAQNRTNNHQAPVYENIEYYPQQPQTYPPYYHPVESRKSPRNSPRGSLAGESYDGGFRKAQPQVPAGNRYQSSSPAKELPPYEAPPVYENIQEVHYGDSQSRPAPQVPANYYPANINGGDYVVMTGKSQGQRNSTQSLGSSYVQSQRARGQSYDSSSMQRSGMCSENPSCMRYLPGSASSSFVDSQSARNAYVPPSELQPNRNYSYQSDQQQQQQHSPRSSLPYHSESPPIRLPPDPHQYHRGSVTDNNTNQAYRQSQIDNSNHNQQGQFRQESSQSYKYPEQSTRNSNSSYHGDPQSRISPGYGPSNRSGESASRNSQCYSPIRGSMSQNERNYLSQVKMKS